MNLNFIPSNYIYFTGTLFFMFVWIIFFILRKDLRKELLIISTLIGISTLITEYYVWTYDWWKPETVMGSRVSFEDFLMGFGNGGIMAIGYKIIFRKKYKNKNLHKLSLLRKILPIFTSIFVMIFLFSYLRISSFWSSLFAFISGIVIIFYSRKDLIYGGLWSGILMVIFSLPFYFIAMIISPEWISKTYMLKNLSGILVLGIPIEEPIFWLLAGALYGTLYQYWTGGKLENKNES